jgi:hypothetical protein
LVEERNKLVRAENDRRKAEMRSLLSMRNEDINKQLAIVAEQRRIEQEKIERDNPDIALNNRLINSIQIDGFGIWNCDFPILQNGIPILAEFVNQSGSPIEVKHISIIAKGLNGIIRSTTNQFKVPPHSECMIVAVCGNRFAYADYALYQKDNSVKGLQSKTIVMTIVDEEDNNPEFIRQIAGL